jgi:hypothetical protein
MNKTYHLIRKSLLALLAMAGIRLDDITAARLITIATIGIGYAAHQELVVSTHSTENATQIAWLYIISLFVIRYAVLFASFVPNGIAPTWIKNYGAEKAWTMYEGITGFMFWQRGLAFGFLVATTEGSLFTLTGTNGVEWLSSASVLIGFLFTLIGLWVNVNATLIIGIDTYFYKDLFLKKALTGFKVDGVYKYFSNPMYGIGQASGYGAALMAGSIEGLAMTLLNQLLMYVFYFLVEKPHVQSVLQQQKISDTARVTVRPMMANG